MIKEDLSQKEFGKLLKRFVEYTAEKLDIKHIPEIEFKDVSDQGEQPSFAHYSPSEKKLATVTKNRHPMDILRSVAHELVHHKQNEDGKLGKSANEGDTGSPIENEANSVAGQIMRWFGKDNPDTFLHSYVTEETIVEGVNDKGILKAVFLAGGAGSGKDYILKRCIEGTGLKELNSDKAFEFILKKNNLSMTMPDSEMNTRNLLRGKAKMIAQKQKELQLGGRLGVIINGTADEYTKIFHLKQEYEKLGYDTMMVFVGTSNKTSRERNIARGQRGGRTVPEVIRFQKWHGANKNKDRFRELFGNDHFIWVDNSVDLSTATPEVKKRIDGIHTEVFKKVKAFVGSPLVNPKGQEWFKNEKTKRGISEMDEKFTEMLNEVGGAGNWGTPKLTHRYQKDTPGQTVGIRMLKMKTKTRAVQKASKIIAADRIGQEYGSQKGPTFGDSQSIDFNGLPDPVAKWIVKEDTINRFKVKYGDQAERKLMETARKMVLSLENVADAYDSVTGATPNASMQDDVRPDTKAEDEKTSLFGNRKKLNKRKN